MYKYVAGNKLLDQALLWDQGKQIFLGTMPLRDIPNLGLYAASYQE